MICGEDESGDVLRVTAILERGRIDYVQIVEIASQANRRCGHGRA